MGCAIDRNGRFVYIDPMAEIQADRVWHPTVLDQVDSTQDWVRRNISVLPDRAVAVASSQTSGRGRLGRSWESPPGGLYASLLFKPAPVLENASKVSLALASVLVGCLEKRGIPAMVKWPNDILVQGGKLAGVLAESGGHGVPWLIIGMGVNLSSVPELTGRRGLPPVSWSAFGKPPDPIDLLDELLSGLDEVWPERAEDPLRNALETINSVLWMKDRKVVFSSGRETHTGEVGGIHRDGGLLLRTETGQSVYYSGELSPAD